VPAAAAGEAGGRTAAQEDGPFLVGQELEVAVGDVAQGGWCVARPEGLPVVFVRHALPGERVVARVTEVTSRFARADAVRVLDPSPDRVEPPCRYAHPGGCGGCDWQHASLAAQRALKADVISQQLRRLAGLDRPVAVEPLPGDEPLPAPQPADETAAAGQAPGLGWRTRVQFAVDQHGAAGLRAHRSHTVVEIDDCLIAHPAIRDLGLTGEDWSGATAVEAAVGGADSTENFAVTVVEAGRPSGKPDAGGQRGSRRGGRHTRAARPRRTLVEGRPYLAEHAAGRIWQVGLDGFWQVHPAAASTLSAAVVAALQPRPGDTVLDLYCGAGLFAGVVAPLVGPQGAVTGIETDPAAVRSARQNLADSPWAAVRQADAARAVEADDLPSARLVVADPPRAGLAREVTAYLAGDGPAERFAYVSCDPATLARDLALLGSGGWELEELRAFDAFPMTHHVECVATLSRSR
jgi:tRNA/tmRNA/rRNA uracil-C5-methylase (TrmA/RlmC/RlmD family)